MSDLLGTVPAFKKLISSRSDDWIDPFSHVYTTYKLIFFAVLVSTGQFVGEPIHCWCPAEFTGAYESYTKYYCWIKNTYYIPMMDTIPVDIQEREDKELTYYQWVPLILLFQAFLFKLPNVIWKILNDGSGLNLDKICALAVDTQSKSRTERSEAIENMAFFLDRWLLTHRQYKRTNVVSRAKATVSKLVCFFCNKRQGTYLTALYLSIKALFVVNIIGQFFLLNAFMATDYNLYGFEYISMLQSGEGVRESPRFPRVTLCDFQIRQLQNIQRWTVQCVLPINLFNEKIFVYLWFWFAFVGFLATYSLLKWLYLIIFKSNNYQFVKKYLTISSKLKRPDNQEHKERDRTFYTEQKCQCREFAEKYLRDDGCFVARMIGHNSNDIVISELLDIMWDEYQKRRNAGRPEFLVKDEETKLLDKDKSPKPNEPSPDPADSPPEYNHSLLGRGGQPNDPGTNPVGFEGIENRM